MVRRKKLYLFSWNLNFTSIWSVPFYYKDFTNKSAKKSCPNKVREGGWQMKNFAPKCNFNLLK